MLEIKDLREMCMPSVFKGMWENPKLFKNIKIEASNLNEGNKISLTRKVMGH